MENNTALYLTCSAPTEIYQSSSTGIKYTRLDQLLSALYGKATIGHWKRDLPDQYGVDLISFKKNRTSKRYLYLFPVSKLTIFDNLFPNNNFLNQVRESAKLDWKPMQDIMLVQDFCKYLKEFYDIDCGRNKMFEFLRTKGFLEKVDSENVPTDKANLLGLFTIVSNITSYQRNGETHYLHFNTPYITFKGKCYLTKLALEYFD